jgi:thioredoxin-dependent peroxiredoxin
MFQPLEILFKVIFPKVGNQKPKNKMKFLIKLNLIVIMATVLTSSIPATEKSLRKEKGKILENQTVPEFQFQDLEGKTHFISEFRGKKVLINFFRNVGCPVCNLRFHEIQTHSDYFQKNKIIVLAIYESSAEGIINYLEGEQYYPVFVADPEEKLYELFSLERSYGKVMKGVMHGAMAKMKKGKRLFKKDIDQDGNMNRIGADFLIDENGKVLISHYHRYLGDELEIDQVKKKVGSN